MSSFSRFQQRNKARTVAQAQMNTSFIFKGYPSIKITGSAGEEIQAAVVNKQEQDYAYIYTPAAQELPIGSIWTAKNLSLLITEEITIIKDVNWHKYHALLCNVQVDNHWGYFIGPEKSYINVALKQNVIIDSQQKPILVLPQNALNVEDKIVIKGRAWLVQEFDSISTEGITYYSLRASTVSKEVADQNLGKDVYIERKPEVPIIITPDDTDGDEIITVAHNQQITLPTEGGYFTSSNAFVKVHRRTSTQVIFSIPFGVDKVVITTGKDGSVVSTYQAV